MKTWEIVKGAYPISDFVSWQKTGRLQLNPNFQRRPIWKPGAKSFLIDTIVRGLPIPIIFLREKKADLKTLETQREVVDGQQRIRTVLSFINPKLLDDFVGARDHFVVQENHNPDVADRAFSVLDPEIRQRILDYQFSVQILPASTDDREVLEIFARINSTGAKLNKQELRNAAWFGVFKTAMYKYASEQLARWRSWKIFNEDAIARMEEVELVSEFALLAIKGLTGKTQKAIDNIYRDYDADFPFKNEFGRRFRHLMDVIDEKFGDDLSASAYRKKTLFYILFAYLYDTSFEIGSSLKQKRPRAITAQTVAGVNRAGERIQAGTAPEAVLDAAARRTTHPGSRKELLRYLRNF